MSLFQVVFAPMDAGHYIAKLHVFSAPMVTDQPLSLSPYPAVITLKAVAEAPRIQVRTRVRPAINGVELSNKW